MRLYLLFAFSIVFPAAAWCESSGSVIDWLNRMTEACHALNYEGTFTYLHDGRMQAMQLFHGTDGHEERERLIALDGASREVVRAGGKVIAILPDHHSMVVDEAGNRAPFPIGVATRAGWLERFYRPQFAGQARIAGRTARGIAIGPRDSFRYGQVLWLDEKTGLLLKAELRDEGNQVVEQLVFTRLEVHDGPRAEQVLRAESSVGALTRYGREGAEPVTAPARSPWVVARLPGGFREVMRRTRRVAGAKAPSEHRVFTDGLAAVSLFIEPAPGEKGPEGRSVRKGALNAYTRHLDNYKVTVLGDVPAATVRLIGDGVALAENKDP